MTEAKIAHREWLDGVVSSLCERPDVVGVVAMGSTADTRRVDEWSDHDVAIIVNEGAETHYGDGSTWLPHPESLVFRTVEHHGGGKAMYADGHLVEWGVATVEGLRGWLADDYRVIVDHGGVAEVMAEISSRPFPANDADAERDIAVFLFELVHGVGRSRRGESLSAGNIIRAEAVGALLSAVRATIPARDPGVLDRLDGLRRVERAYPDLAADIARACAQDVEDAAQSLLRIAIRHLGLGPGGVPADGAAAVAARLGWPPP